MKSINFKILTALTKHNKMYFYIDGKRVSYLVYKGAESYCSRFDCLQTVIKGDKVTQLKTGIIN